MADSGPDRSWRVLVDPENGTQTARLSRLQRGLEFFMSLPVSEAATWLDELAEILKSEEEGRGT